MTTIGGYHDMHKGEEIRGECPHCHLPVYVSDPSRYVSIPPGSQLALYHSGCAMSAQGVFWEEQITADAARLRGCGYVVELRIIRPVH